MFDLTAYVLALAPIAGLAVLTWMVSIAKRDASIVDSVWSLLLLAAACTYAVATAAAPRTLLVLVLVTAWALRLSAYITWRNWGEPEDHRYVAIRERNEPNYAAKSLYLVFGLQGVLAWIVSLPLLGALASARPVLFLDWLGVAIVCAGIGIETIADAQLARFKADPANRGKVMDRGLWRYTRHPNYFGEFLVWWGFYMIALGAGAWWAIVSPLLMSVLLLRISGVALLEKDIQERRPAYRDYVARTNAFFPGPSRATTTVGRKEVLR